MTTITGFQGNGFAILGADSQITDGDKKIISASTPKIVEIGKYLLGVCGDCRPGDVLMYSWKAPAYDGSDPVKFMGKKVIPSIVKAFKENGYDYQKENASFAYLLAFAGNIFEIGGDLSISQSQDNIYGIGSGSSYAIGYLSALLTPANGLESAKTIINKALEISAKHDVNTSAPFKIAIQISR
jgi:ATP-dependent protease HslVU (ClpYQ) peptidase subunit